jgi:Family of unknown function (DUF5989)
MMPCGQGRSDFSTLATGSIATMTQPENHPPSSDRFAEQANQPSAGLFCELLAFLLHNKKWWLAPILIVLALVGVLVILAGTSAAPFIYTLF